MLKNKKLNCGVRVAMEKLPHVESASVGIWVRAGSADETERNSGISHFIEHMMFKGTKNRNAKEIAEDVDRIGGHTNAFTGKEATCYYVKTLKNNLEKACDILLDMLLNSLFDTEELNKEREVIFEEMKMTEDSPDELAQDLLYETVFKGTELESSIIGTAESLKGIDRELMIEYIRENYARDNIVIAIAGNFDEDEVCAYLDGKFASFSEKKSLRENCYGPYAPSSILRIKDIEQTQLALGVRGLPLEDDNYFSLALLNNIMGGSMSSRLFQTIREEKGLAYTVYSSASSYVHTGIYGIYLGVSHAKAEEALRAIAYELEKLEKDLVTDDELAMAKEQLKSSYIFGQENVNGRMFSVGKNTLLLGKVNTQQEIIDEIDGVTMKGIRKAAELITDLSRYSAVMVGRNELDLERILRS